MTELRRIFLGSYDGGKSRHSLLTEHSRYRSFNFINFLIDWICYDQRSIILNHKSWLSSNMQYIGVLTCRKPHGAPLDRSKVTSPNTRRVFPDFITCSLPILPSGMSVSLQRDARASDSSLSADFCCKKSQNHHGTSISSETIIENSNLHAWTTKRSCFCTTKGEILGCATQLSVH